MKAWVYTVDTLEAFEEYSAFSQVLETARADFLIDTSHLERSVAFVEEADLNDIHFYSPFVHYSTKLQPTHIRRYAYIAVPDAVYALFALEKLKLSC